MQVVEDFALRSELIYYKHFVIAHNVRKKRKRIGRTKKIKRKTCKKYETVSFLESIGEGMRVRGKKITLVA